MFEIVINIVVEFCLSSRAQDLTSTQLIVITWEPQFKKLGRVILERRRLEKAKTRES